MKPVAISTLAVLIGGCLRLGYAPASNDGGVDTQSDGRPQSDGDQSLSDVADAAIEGPTHARLDDPCNPPSCEANLVCTGAQSTWFCRPSCAEGCSAEEVCGRPLIDGEVDPEAPMACLSTKKAGRLEDCRTISCDEGLRCFRGGADLCLGTCVTSASCLPNETCEKGACFPACIVEDKECPEGMYCAGFGDLQNKCVPDKPLPLGASCLKGPCEPSARCVGWSSEATTPHHCHLLCDDAMDCSPGESCASVGPAKFCFRECSLFDPGACEAWEVCVAVSIVQEVLCIPAEGDPDSCADGAPCVSGKICVGGVCNQACDESHPCQSGTCAELAHDGTPMPWKACKP